MDDPLDRHEEDSPYEYLGIPITDDQVRTWHNSHIDNHFKKDIIEALWEHLLTEKELMHHLISQLTHDLIASQHKKSSQQEDEEEALLIEGSEGSDKVRDEENIDESHTDDDLYELFYLLLECAHLTAQIEAIERDIDKHEKEHEAEINKMIDDLYYVLDNKSDPEDIHVLDTRETTHGSRASDTETVEITSNPAEFTFQDAFEHVDPEIAEAIKPVLAPVLKIAEHLSREKKQEVSESVKQIVTSKSHHHRRMSTLHASRDFLQEQSRQANQRIQSFQAKLQAAQAQKALLENPELSSKEKAERMKELLAERYSKQKRSNQPTSPNHHHASMSSAEAIAKHRKRQSSSAAPPQESEEQPSESTYPPPKV